MKNIKHKNYDISINTRGFNIDSNTANYTVVSSLVDLPEAIALFGGNFTMNENQNFIQTKQVSINDLADIMKLYRIESIDVGKTVEEALRIFCINILWNANLLELNLSDWALL